MKIINWNVGRPTNNKCERILTTLEEQDGDILVLTETNSSIHPGKHYNLISTVVLPSKFDGVLYKGMENRVSVWTRFPMSKSHKALDDYTSVCCDIATPLGLLRVYGTIIGVFGGLGQRFQEDLKAQLSDFNDLFPGRQVCLVGDYNISFSGYAYPSHLARETLNDVFHKYRMKNLTSEIANNVDHIAITENFIEGKNVRYNIWNEDKWLSDHIGVCVTITE